MELTSPAFEHGSVIPRKFTCDGDNVSPGLAIAEVPEGARSLVLLMDDPDVPRAVREDRMFDHLVLFNIPPDTRVIPEGESAGVAGVNTAGSLGYTGPCPPPQFEPKEHRYVFSLYALDCELPLEAGTSKEQVRSAMKGHLLAKAELIGRYARA